MLPAILADSVPDPTLHRVDHLPRPMWSQLRADARSLSCPGQHGLSPRSCGVDQISRPTRTRVRGAVGWTSCPGRLVPGSELTQGRPAVLNHLVPGPS